MSQLLLDLRTSDFYAVKLIVTAKFLNTGLGSCTFGHRTINTRSSDLIKKSF